MADDDQDAGDVVRQLLTTPPAEFVAERNRLAKALKKDGDTDAAAAIAALRRPSVADWAFNVLAGEQPEEIDAFADAATEVQEAQAAAIEGRSGTDIRDAVRALREQTAALVALARTVVDKPGVAAAGSSVSELTARLAEVAGSAQATASLRAGLLGVGEPGDADPFGGLDVPARPKRRAESATAPSSKPAKAAKSAQGRAKSDEKGDDKAAKEAAAEQASAEARRARVRDLADAERAHARATKQLERVHAELERLAATSAKAEVAYDEAAKRLEAAQQQFDEGASRRSKAADAVAAAESALAKAQKAVDADR
jgi:hypothetical protein